MDEEKTKYQKLFDGAVGVCTPGYEGSCLNAHNDADECTCQCGGANHGKALLQPTDEDQNAVIKQILGDKK